MLTLTTSGITVRLFRIPNMKLYTFKGFTVLLEDEEAAPKGALSVHNVDTITGDAIKAGATPILFKGKISVDQKEVEEIERNILETGIRQAEEAERLEKDRQIILLEALIKDVETNPTK